MNRGNMKTLWYVELIADNTNYNIMVRADARTQAVVLAMANSRRDGCRFVNELIKVERIG